MDLRKFKMPENLYELVTKSDGEKTSRWYQPFIFRDDLITGSCGPWALRTPSQVCTSEDPLEIRQAFLREAIKIGDYYDKLNRILIESIPNAHKILEIGCNAGHLCFDLARQGRQVTGVDIWKATYEIIKNIIGVEFEYLNTKYNSRTHMVPELQTRTFDVAITVNLANHLIDLPYFTSYIGSKATKGILFVCLTIPGETPILKLRIRAGRKDNPLLQRFEYLPATSAIELMLYSLNFKYVYRCQHCKEDPSYTKNWGVWLVLNKEISEEITLKYNLCLVKNRVEEYADKSIGVLSLPKKK